MSDIRLLARQAIVILQSSCVTQLDSTISTLESSIYYVPNVTLNTSQDTTLSSEMVQTTVLQRTNREPWEPVSRQIVFYEDFIDYLNLLIDRNESNY